MCKFNIVNDWKCEKPQDQAFHIKEGGEGLRFHWNCAWYHLCTVCMASILPSRSHGRYNPLLQCKGHIFPSSVKRCSAEQRKYLGKKRSGSSLKGSFNRQRTTAGCYSTKPFLVKVQPLLTSKQCATWTEWRSRHVRSLVLRQGAVANEAPSQASARTHRGQGWLNVAAQSHLCGQRHLLRRGTAGTGRIAHNNPSSPLSKLSLNTPKSPPMLSKGRVLLGTKLVNSAHIEQGGESKGKPKFYLQIQKCQNSPSPILCAKVFWVFFVCFVFLRKNPKEHTWLWMLHPRQTAGRGFLACCQGTSPSHHLLRNRLSLQNGMP